jgi:hypothetical protein
MRRVTVLASLVLSATTGFGAAYLPLHMSAKQETGRALEEQALQGVIHSLITSSYLQRNDPKTLSEANEAILYGYLRLLDENKGYNTNPDWLKAKVRTLNALSIQWDKKPPFSWQAKEQPWQSDFEQGQAKNMALLQWAKAECLAHPEYDCKKNLQ